MSWFRNILQAVLSRIKGRSTKLYLLKNGTKLSLDGLTTRQRRFVLELEELANEASNADEYVEVYRTALGPGSPGQLTGNLAEYERGGYPVIYQIALDIVERLEDRLHLC